MTVPKIQRYYWILLFFSITYLLVSCKGEEIIRPTEEVTPPPMEEEPETPTPTLVEGVDYFLPKIDLNNWKVTLPIGNPTEVKPPEILEYAEVEVLKEFMYNDSTDGSLVFYTYPGASTTNSSYSRTELREQMVPGSNNTNWTFAQGGRMKGTLAVSEISRNGNTSHRTMVMQIHGRLTNAQRDLIGENDNNAPPMLKVYWQKDGQIRVLTKKLKDVNASAKEMLETDAWTDNEGHNFSKNVGTDKFTLEVIVADGRLEVILNDDESVVYDDIHLEKWGVFENYFKAGNYLQTTAAGSFAKVKYYDLVISH